MGEIKISMIAAVARNGVIGANGKMAWYIPSDFAHFKRITMGKPMIMGRKQFESVGRALPGRTNIVVSRQKNYQPEGVVVINDFAAAIDHARSIALADGAKEVMIIGGGQIYRLGMALADRLYLSHVELDIAGDVVFPELDLALWEMDKQLPVTPDKRDQAAYSIKVYLRRADKAH
ncbi:Dihydrofolate reductase [hydrothermal vent metagenome]|uniref:dihydrofolate reductase n=1 Tax=hydrothermal vent metagenome TaxID=652676 RepID=A0A3B0TP61_9ZZZZ